MSDKNKKISIVIPYYNRLNLLRYTLDSIFQSKYSNYEIIIVDDASDDYIELKKIEKQFNNIKIININKEDKGERTNPSVPLNRGIKAATGEILVIQNPESYHVGDVLTYTNRNLNRDDYFVFPTYNLHTENANSIFINIDSKTLEEIKKIPKNNDWLEWFQHPEYRNCKYHFCVSTYKNNVDIIGGFDEEYANGVCFDDDDFVFKIESVGKFNLKSLYPTESPFIVNLYHPPSSSNGILSQPDTNVIKQKWLRNEKYYKNKISSINNLFMYPRIVHFFWFGSLPFLNYLSIISFHKHHPAWIINVYKSNNANTDNIWGTGEQQNLKNNKKDYFVHLQNLKYVNIISADEMTKELGIQGIYMVHQSDIMRMYILNKYGGVYSDFDIIYTENIENYFINKTKTLVFDRMGNKGERYCPNAFFISLRNNDFCKFVVERQLNYVKNQKVKGYNNVGPEIVKTTTFDPKYSFARSNIEILDSGCYLPLEWNELEKLYIDKDFNVNFKYFSIHWFNGASLSKEYIDNFNIINFKINCKMDKLISDYIMELKKCEDDKYYFHMYKKYIKNITESIFNKMYINNIWSKSLKETKSGSGSSITNTQEIRKELPLLFENLNIKSILDAGCGDFNWFKEINLKNINYMGVDIVNDIIIENKNLYETKNIKFYQKDIITEDLPCVDLIICRDCLVLFSDSNIKQTLRNFKKSGSKYLLITNFLYKRQNVNIETGSWRPINFTEEPYVFSLPLKNINEKCTEANNQFNDKSLSLWNLSEIKLV